MLTLGSARPRIQAWMGTMLRTFHHFDICTFTGCEHNSGTANASAGSGPPSAFNPTAINDSQVPAAEGGTGGCENHAHGVTYNEVSKLFAMGYSFSGNRSHLLASVTAYDLLSKFDMQVYGVNSGDEDLNGIAPNAATETCDVSDFICERPSRTSWQMLSQWC